VTLRRFKKADLGFLYRVYAASRAEEMALLTHWSAAEKENFLRFQFEAQHKHYQENYPHARYDIIVKGSERIGRFYVARMQNEIRLMDMALLPEHRNQGIGSALLRDLLDEAEGSRKFVSLHVEPYNPAKRLYERLGFVVVGEVSFYQLMHWIPLGLTPIHEGEI
jgi:ribosomal protein S18 acetylase RimI-like enzyme